MKKTIIYINRKDPFLNDCCELYHARVMELENEGLTTSDAQGIADLEHSKIHN